MTRFQLRAPLCPGAYGHIYSYFHLRAESSSNPFSQIGGILLPPVVRPLLLNLQAHSGPRPPKTWTKRLILFARCHKKCYVLFAFVYIYIYTHMLTSVLLKIHKGECQIAGLVAIFHFAGFSNLYTLSKLNPFQKPASPHISLLTEGYFLCSLVSLSCHHRIPAFEGIAPDQPVLPRVLVNQILFPYQRLREEKKKRSQFSVFFKKV